MSGVRQTVVGSFLVVCRDSEVLYTPATEKLLLPEIH